MIEQMIPDIKTTAGDEDEIHKSNHVSNIIQEQEYTIDDEFPTVIPCSEVIPIYYGKLPSCNTGVCAICFNQNTPPVSPSPVPRSSSNSFQNRSTTSKDTKINSPASPVDDTTKSASSSPTDMDVEAAVPIILCDGENCTREFHLTCLDPPLSIIPEGDWFCNDCDEFGASKHLKKYFEDIDMRRGTFSSSQNYVEYLLKQAEVVADTGLMIDITGTQDEKEEKKNLQSTSNNFGSKLHRRRRYPRSELSKISIFYSQCMTDLKQQSNQKSVDALASPTKDMFNDKALGPSFLVGKAIRLYCPVDNTYHIGRILDWRHASVYESNRFYGEGSIGMSEFFIHFPAGSNGRKKTIQQWMILEEHSLAVSLKIVWGQLKKGRGLVQGWKPAQILLRTTLELIPVRELVDESSDDEDFNHEDENQDQRGDAIDSRSKKNDDKQKDITKEKKGLNKARIPKTKGKDASNYCNQGGKKDDKLDEDLKVKVESKSTLSSSSVNRRNPNNSKQKKKAPRELRALVQFFGDDTYTSLRLIDEVMDFFAPSFDNIRQNFYQSGSFPNRLALLDDSKTGNAVAASSTITAQEQGQAQAQPSVSVTASANGSLSSSSSCSHRNYGQNYFLTMAIALASIEIEQEKRVQQWQRLPLMNPAHMNALTLLDESTLPPLVIQSDAVAPHGGSNEPGITVQGYDSLDDNASVSRSNKRKRSSSPSGSTDSREERKQWILPRLCPLIEQGLDRMWLADLIECNGSIQRTLDTMRSMSCAKVKDLTSAIAQMNRAK